MADAATTILNAVEAAVTGLYPAVPVKQSKRASTDRKNPASGWQAGFPAPCFVVSCGDPEEIDGRASFTQVTVGYPVLVEYVWAAQAAIANPPNEGNPVGVEDPAIRDIRTALRNALYKPYLVNGTTRDVQMKTRKPYDVPGTAGDGRLVSSGEEFRYMVTEPRPSPT